MVGEKSMKIEQEKYTKLIFQRGSVILRKVKAFRFVSKNQLFVVDFEDGSQTTMDMFYLRTALGEYITTKDNIYVEEVQTLSINDVG